MAKYFENFDLLIASAVSKCRGIFHFSPRSSGSSAKTVSKHFRPFYGIKACMLDVLDPSFQSFFLFKFYKREKTRLATGCLDAVPLQLLSSALTYTGGEQHNEVIFNSKIT